MKGKVKNINFPTLLLLVTSIFQIKSVYYSLISIFQGPVDIFYLLNFVEMLCPIVLFVILFLGEDKKKILGIASIVFGGVTLVNGLRAVPNLIMYDEFVELLVGGPFFNVLSSILIGVLLLILGVKLMANGNVAKRYYFLCGLSIFLVAYASIFMAIANPLAIISKLPTFFYVLSLWYIPKLYSEVEAERTKVRMTSKKVKTIIVVVVIMYIVLGMAGGLSGTSSNSSHPNQPWKDLGVSEKEYMDVYNYYKYGTPIR